MTSDLNQQLDKPLGKMDIRELQETLKQKDRAFAARGDLLITKIEEIHARDQQLAVLQSLYAETRIKLSLLQNSNAHQPESTSILLRNQPSGE